MRTTLRTRFFRLFAREGGFVLPLALGFVVVLGIATATSVTYATQNQKHVSYAKQDQLAQSYAEAALARAFATVYAASDPRNPGAVSETTVAFEKGTGTYSGAYVTGNWTLTGVGRVANPNHGSDIVRIARGRTSVGTGQRGSANNAVWNYIFVDDTSSCTTLGNSVTINIPLYVRGNLCLEQGASLTSEAYALQVGGYLQFSNTAHVGGGAVGERLQEAHIGGGCRVGTSGPFTNPCGDGTRVFTVVPPDANPTGLTKPPLDLAYWYANAGPGPIRGCTSGSFPGGFDNDTVLNRSRGDIDIAPDTDYDCTLRDGSGSIIGRIAWNHITQQLSIQGTIFFDGNIVFRNQTRITYDGRATIYASGQVTMNQQTIICGVATCDEEWKPLENLLAFVAGSSTDASSFLAGNYTRFQGAIYAVNDYTEGNNAEIWGPIVARKVFMQNSAKNFYVPIGTLLPGMPATYDEVVVLSNDPQGWG